jgi:hypothetical protein
VSADIIPFVPRPRGRRPGKAPIPFRSPVQPDDLVMDHADTAPCEYPPGSDQDLIDNEPA